MNFVRDFVATRPADDRAVVTLAADGRRDEWTFGRLIEAAGSLAAVFAEHDLGRGDVVLTLVGNRIEYLLSILAGVWIGSPLLPCSEQLRPKDIALRLARARPALIVCDERNRRALDAAEPAAAVLTVPDDSLLARREPPPFAELADEDPAVVLFTSGTTGQPKLVTHAHRWLSGQLLQAEHWVGALPGELMWSTAAPGWSKATRNSFLAPWLCGASALLQDARFDAAQRLATIRAEQVNVLCMAPTEYRLIAAAGPIGPLPSLRRAITAGEPLGAPAYLTWREQTGLAISDGYGQTETGQITGVRPGEEAPPGSMGRPLPGIRTAIVEGELVIDPATVPTFFLGYDNQDVPEGMWHTGDHVRQDDHGWLYFEARADDVIISAGYRIGPAEVESTLLGHPAVRECAVFGVPDEARGQLVAAAVVLRDGYLPDVDLVAQLKDHVRSETAPYKYPRRIWFVDELPKTTSGKISRAALRPPE
ncbi:MAG: acetyl-CoA synthetase [Pseudonocardiales bacterium]|nr:acetyl-CoA synthetase [Pseudonocardiales bacterium]